MEKKAKAEAKRARRKEQRLAGASGPPEPSDSQLEPEDVEREMSDESQ